MCVMGIDVASFYILFSIGFFRSAFSVIFCFVFYFMVNSKEVISQMKGKIYIYINKSEIYHIEIKRSPREITLII